MNALDAYDIIIGLEVHIQLNTASKIFASDENAFGAAPNTLVSPITLALPGVLPRLNAGVLDKAIRMGLACHCHIAHESQFARKNYFYADLPKGYQISQDKLPVCSGGYIPITVHGQTRQVTLTRIHMEEDAGKNNHELDPDYSLIDLNRAGVPLLELVTEPDIRSSEEAYAFLTEVRKLVRYLDICDGNMEEGSLRCDANISLRKKGEPGYRNRVEVKNMNSIRNVKRAIDAEVKRQLEIYENGGTIDQETRSFNQADASSFPLRTKENAHDYRYFPDPDLPPVFITQEQVDAVRASMPELPEQLIPRLQEKYKLSEYDARQLCEERETAAYFIELVQHTNHYKPAANWIINELRPYIQDKALTWADLPLKPSQLAELLQLLEDRIVSNSGAKTIFQHMTEGAAVSAVALAEQLNLVQSSDQDELRGWAQQALAKFPDKVKEYHKGKKGNINLFMGEVMKLSRGAADPQLTTQILTELLKQ